MEEQNRDLFSDNVEDATSEGNPIENKAEDEEENEDFMDILGSGQLTKKVSNLIALK